MKTIGLLGGMTYRSTLLYYSQINAHIQGARGSPHAASIVLHSFDFGEISAFIKSGDWDAVAARFGSAAQHMKAAGAHGVAIGCNVGHRVAGEVEASSGLPVLHIAEFAARAVRERGLRRVALLGTREAIEGDFIRGPLSERADVEVLVPGSADTDTIDGLIFGELGGGVVTEATRVLMARVVHELVQRGAEGVVLACTDLQFVIKPESVSVPIFDTLELHAKGLADWALED
jgi:aspartate racemase